MINSISSLKNAFDNQIWCLFQNVWMVGVVHQTCQRNNGRIRSWPLDGSRQHDNWSWHLAAVAVRHHWHQLTLWPVMRAHTPDVNIIGWTLIRSNPTHNQAQRKTWLDLQVSTNPQHLYSYLVKIGAMTLQPGMRESERADGDYWRA